MEIPELSVRDLALNSAIVATAIKVIWTLLTEVLKLLRNIRLHKTLDLLIPIFPYRKEYDGLVNFNCLVVRYGTDQYFQHLASDRERHDGKLQNKTIPLQVIHEDSTSPKLGILLPVHKRLGTQFKCFADINDPARIDEFILEFSKCNRISRLSKSSSQFHNRVYFILNDFGTAKTVDGFINNICLPE
jgi:hypothetical protein